MTRPPDPILYSFRRCPYAMRARLALAVSGTRVELREVKLTAKPAAMLAASAKATVPVLVLPNGEVIDESLDIMRWALARCDPDAWLERNDAALIAANDGPFKQDLDRYKYPQQHAVDPLVHRESGLAFLRQIDFLVSAGKQLGGRALGLTDAAIVPFVRQFAAVDPPWFNAQPLPHLRPWLEDYLRADLFHSIMLPVEPWSPGNAPTLVPLPVTGSRHQASCCNHATKPR
ncbi:glutathione S-transferase [Sphingomonas sp.]|uniref:glutathione S-transferase n=1 Tax=Sphingomonas sp. TaxID=28214 RepID=UPI00286A797E|nr:glutathione S-transferase [Sphingomonas sp.]